MILDDAISLIDTGDLNLKPGNWIDLGCGEGLFTRALVSLLSPGSTITAIDRQPYPSFNAQAPAKKTEIHFLQMDFLNTEIPFRDLDGILMANALHFVPDALSFLGMVANLLQVNGSLIIVEYDTHQSSRWVPYPVPFARLRNFAREAGYPYIRQLNSIPSIYRTASIYGAHLRK